MSSEIPRWLELQAEIDYLYFCLNQLREKSPRTPIEISIDEASGRTAQRIVEAREICIRMKELKKEMSTFTLEEYNTEMEDAILAIK